jgi:hypothetical protein
LRKKIYILFVFFLGLFFSKHLNAQSYLNLDVAQANKHKDVQSYLNLEAAQVFSTFKFTYKLNESNTKSTSGNPLYSQINSAAFGLGYSCIGKKGMIIIGSLGFRKAGASLVYKKINYLWNLQYIDAKIGVGYQYNKWRLKPYSVLSPYYAYLLNAKQSVGLSYYDIKASRSLKGYDFGLFINVGIKAALSQYILLYAEYNYNLGLKNLETAQGQYLYNRGFSIKLGLAFSITNFKAMQDQLEKGPAPQQQNFDYSEYNDPKNNNPQNNTAITATKPPSENTGNQSSEKTKISAQSGSAESQKIITPGTQGWGNNKTATQQKNVSISSSANVDNAAVDAGSVALKGGKEEPINNKESKFAANSEKSANSSNVPKTAGSSSAQQSGFSAVPVDAGNNDDEVKALISPEAKSVTENSKNKIEFKVQLTSTKNLLQNNHPLIKKSKGKIQAEKGKDGWIHYYYGSYDNYQEARSELKELKTMGLTDGGFIVAFKNGKKITVAQAKELVK